MQTASIVLMIISGTVLVLRIAHLQRMEEIRAMSSLSSDED
jgi:hypothetical protein